MSGMHERQRRATQIALFSARSTSWIIVEELVLWRRRGDAHYMLRRSDHLDYWEGER
jgi:hypothetical protein